MTDVKYIDLGLLILRIALGTIFMAHGSQKLFGLFQGPGIQGFTEMIKGLGFPLPVVFAWIAALSEGLGGLFLLLGIIPRISAGLIAIIMIVAITKIHGTNGFFMKNGGIEYQFLILLNTLSLIICGAGKYSLYNKF